MSEHAAVPVDVYAELLRENSPPTTRMDVRMYADALITYREAAANIAANGVICSHPRTGAPIENPYLKVRTQAGGVMERLSKRVKSDKTIGILAAQDAATSPTP